MALYEAIVDASQLMLAAMRRRDRQGLVDAERQCAVLIARVQAMAAVSGPLDEHGMKRKQEIMRSLLADDAEMRNLTQPWLTRLDAHLGRRRSSHPAESSL
jgi:flagellar protein FliT